MRRPAQPYLHQPDVLTLAGGTWLAAGVVVYLLTPLPFRDAAWGWTPAFWLLLAPAIVLCVQRWCMPRVPVRGAAIRRGARRQGLAPSRSATARRPRAVAAMRVPARAHGKPDRRAG